MANKRRDHKNRILKTGESQRKDLTYMYRFTDAKGKRQCVYANTLEALREKEAEIQKTLERGILYDGNTITVSELCERYLEQKVKAKTYSKQTQASILKRIQKSEISDIPIAKIRTSMAKAYTLSLEDEDIAYGTIRNTYLFLKAAFRFAYEDDIIPKNPFDFKFSSVMSGKNGKRDGLTPDEQKELLKFISGSRCFTKRLDDIIILIGTGLRIGEFCALTKDDIDFSKKTINVNKQIQRYQGGIIKITEPKTEAGNRMIPMNDDVLEAMWRVMKRRSEFKTEIVLDGYTGFLFRNQDGNVALPHNYESFCRRVQKAFNDTHTMQVRITPHVFRHTFCTNLVRAGVNITSIQYLMGHSNADLSLNVYTDKTFEDAEIAYKKAFAVR